MTVNANDRRKTYPGNGVATVFNGPRALFASHVQVYLVDPATNIATATSAYTLTGVGGSGTVVTMDAPVPTGTTLLILRVVGYSQDCDISNQDAYLPETLENAGLDPIVMQTQQLADQVRLALRVADTVVNFNPLLPTPVANRFLVFNGAGDGVGIADNPPSADLTLRGDLALSGAGKGAELIAVRDTADLFAGTTLEAVLAEIVRRTAITPERYGAVGDGVADDGVAMDLAAQAAAGGVLRLTPGKTYRLASVRYGTGTALRLASGTTIDARGATIKRGSSALGVLVSNNANGVAGGYNANSDISIIGGTWDGNYPTLSSACCVFGFVHMTGVTLRDVTIKGVAANHHLEINACSRVHVDNCTFLDGAEQSDITMEAIQIDGAIGAGNWGVGPYDNTFCSGVRINNCRFINCGTGVGSHSAVAGKSHTNIQVTNCTFSGCFYAGIRALAWEGFVATGNLFYQGLYGIVASAVGSGAIVGGCTITNNQFWHIGATAYTGAVAGDGHAVYLFGNVGGTEMVSNFTIANNVIRDSIEAKSGHGIKVDRCNFGSINGNVIANLSLGSGIDVFTTTNVPIQNNSIATITGGAFYGIKVNTGTTQQHMGNRAPTMNIVNSDKIITSYNIVTAAGGISATSNTNHTLANNLQGAAFA